MTSFKIRPSYSPCSPKRDPYMTGHTKANGGEVTRQGGNYQINTTVTNYGRVNNFLARHTADTSMPLFIHQQTRVQFHDHFTWLHYSQSNDIIPKKNVSYIANVLNISTKATPVCSLSTPPSNKRTFISLAQLLAELAYLTMLFILPLRHTAVHQLKNKYHC